MTLYHGSDQIIKTPQWGCGQGPGGIRARKRRRRNCHQCEKAWVIPKLFCKQKCMLKIYLGSLSKEERKMKNEV
jgi:hypothetical protein